MLSTTFIFFSFIPLIVADAPFCPDPNGGAADVPCQILAGCNFENNGTLTPLATQCSNELPDQDCEQLFNCNAETPGGNIACARPGAAGTTAEEFPYVRSPACLSPNLRDIALQCANTCGMCCESPEYNCDDDDDSPIDCELNKGKCRDSNWTNIMSQYCPRTCGLCANGTCTDINTGCNTMTALCKHVDWLTYMQTNCARTCDYCDTTTTSSCSDIASNCAPNANLCTNAIYRDLMLQQCCATCSGTTVSSVVTSSVTGTCSDSNSNCANWVRNGFCSSTFYTTAQKRQYCGRSCNLC